MRGGRVPDAPRERLPQALQGLHLIEHAVETVVHPVPATVGRLVDVGLHAGEVRRHAHAKGACGLQGDGLPIARRLCRHQALQLQGEVVLEPHVVLQDDCQRLRLSGEGYPAHGAQVRRGATDHAPDPVHGPLRPLCIETRGDDALALHPRVCPGDGHVYPRDKLRLDPQLGESRRHETPPRDIPGQIQHVYRDVCLQPRLCGLHFGWRRR
mmetsp:Transcript_53903/g.167041  ORF Transcript_53903/g.167041 Transcript_53903/m.167041 type:complete len:211 (-) Transcript_53903:607-1239(-)